MESQPTINNLLERIAQLEKENAELRDFLCKDALTGLYTQRYFKDFIVPELENYIEYQKQNKRSGSQRLVFGVADINAMNLINERLGHLGGDQALISTANVLKNATRSTDWVGRSGEAGDEFYIVLRIQPDQNVYDVVSAVDNRIKAGMEAIGLGIPVSLSVGFTLIEPCISVNEVVECADISMYKSKEAWKNRQKLAGKTVANRVLNIY